MEPYVRNYIKACEAFGWEGGPEYNTEIIAMQNKAEKRNARWSQSRFFATVPFLNLSPERYDSVLAMFEGRMGRWGAFLYRNPLSYTADDVEFGVGDAVKTEFQLVAEVQVGLRKRTRNVYAIYTPEEDSNGDAVPSDVIVRVNGTVTPVSIDYDRGLVTFSSAPAFGAVLTWEGEFSHWVRFANDRLPFSIDNRSGEGFATNGMIEVVEVNPPIMALSS